MAIVVDSSLLIVLCWPDPRSGAVERRVQEWLDRGEELHAPMLLPYEVASALTRLVTSGRITRDELISAWQLVETFPVQLHAVGGGLRITETALRLGRQSAYDAAYLVLAAALGAELWTLDGPLARNAASLGFPVHLANE